MAKDETEQKEKEVKVRALVDLHEDQYYPKGAEFKTTETRAKALGPAHVEIVK